MSFLPLTDYRSGEPLFIDPSTIAVIKQVPETPNKPRHTQVEWTSGRVFMVKEEAEEIMLLLNPNPTEPEIQEDWKVILQCVLDTHNAASYIGERDQAYYTSRAYCGLLKFLRSARLPHHPTFNSNTILPQ